MLLDLLKDNMPTIATGIIAAIAWIFERNKRVQEQKKSTVELEQLQVQLSKADTENQNSVMDLYQEALDDLKTRYDVKFKELQDDLIQVRKNLNESKSKYAALKKEFDNYKKKNR